jgi:hypothetical protein
VQTCRAIDTSRIGVEDRAAVWGDAFAQAIIDSVVQPLIKMFDPTCDFTLRTTYMKGLVDIGVQAYQWSHKARSSHLEHDFHPVLVASGQPYDQDVMRLGERYKLGADDSIVVACVGLGLQSSVAVIGKEPERVWEEKVLVLTEAYFRE